MVNDARLRVLLQQQDLAIARAQALALGATDPWLTRRVTSGRWQRLHPGVYVAHNGPVPWRTRAVAALLHAGPGAALSHASAAHLHGFDARPPQVLDVSLPATRTAVGRPGELVVHRRRAMPPAHGWLRVVERGATVVDLANATASADGVVGLVSAALRARTRPQEITAALAVRQRVRNRRLLLDLMDEVVAGIESPLEHRYQHDVERRHGLPAASLQVRQKVDGWWIRADRIYAGLGVRVELDGRIAHPNGRTDADTWRDNAVLIATQEITLRYRWRHVAVDPCATARQVEAALRSRGWSGAARRCGTTCLVTA